MLWALNSTFDDCGAGRGVEGVRHADAWAVYLGKLRLLRGRS